MRIELKHTNLNMGVMGALTDSLERIFSQLYKHNKSCCPSYLIILFASYTSKKLKKKFRFLCIPLCEDIIWDLWKLATDLSYPTVPSILYAGDQKRNNSSVSNSVQDAPFTDFPPPTTGGNVTDWKCYCNIK